MTNITETTTPTNPGSPVPEGVQGLHSERKSALDQLDGIINTARNRDGGLLASEQRAVNKLEARIEAIDDQLAQRTQAAQAVRERQERFDQLAKRYAVPAQVEVFHRGIYTGQKGAPSFFGDIYRSQRGDWHASQRLAEHASTQQRALNTTAGAAGEFAPPAWLEEEFVALARPGRVTADLLHSEDLPAGISSINIPKMATGTQTAVQSPQNSPIQMTDATTSSVSSSIVTVAGGQVISQQLLDQSPINVDRVLLQDLAADYSRQLNALVLSSASSPLAGLGSVGTAITYTDTTPTGAKLLSKVAGAVATVNQQRYAPPTHIVMTPSRWAWLCAQTDNNGRPLVTPAAVAQNPVATTQNGPNGLVGEMLGLPVYADASLPANLGAGTNQDEILVMRADDSWLFESDIRCEGFPQTYAQNLSVLLRCYCYVALVHRQPKSIAVIGGTGLVAPTF